MATITININNDVEKEFRETVKEKLGERKGVLGEAVETAIKKWIEEARQKQIAAELMKMMDNGLYSLKGWKFNRDEIYDRV